MTQVSSQYDHDKLVKRIAGFLTDDAYSCIRADIPGYVRPLKIIWPQTNKGAAPDITYEMNGTEIIIEVETDDSIDDNLTIDQWKLFSAYASQPGVDFMIAVPSGSKEKAEKIVDELDIKAVVIELGL